jgi:hypothetical protein
MRTPRRALRLLGASLAMAGYILTAGQSPAHAVGTGGVLVAGSGTISPGLTTVPTPQSFTFTTSNPLGLPSIAAVGSTNGGVNAVFLGCSFSGVSSFPGGETAALGMGFGSGSCVTAASIVGFDSNIMLVHIHSGWTYQDHSVYLHDNYQR